MGVTLQQVKELAVELGENEQRQLVDFLCNSPNRKADLPKQLSELSGKLRSNRDIDTFVRQIRSEWA